MLCVFSLSFLIKLAKSLPIEMFFSKDQLLCSLIFLYFSFQASLLAQSVQNPPAMQEIASNTGDTDSILESERFPGGGNGNPLQYSCPENPRDRGAWWATLLGVLRVRHDFVTKAQRCSLLFYDSYFHSNLVYCLLSACLGFGLLFFSKFFRQKIGSMI